MINEYLQHYPRIFEDAYVTEHAINRVVGELRSLGLSRELCSRISQLIRENAKHGETELLGSAYRHGDEEGSGQAPESTGEFQRVSTK